MRLCVLLSAALFASTTASADPVTRISGSCPGNVIVEVTGATPGAPVMLAYGMGPGSVTVPVGAPACVGVEVDVNPETVKVISLGTANVIGEAATLVAVMNPALCGATAAALDVATCTPSPAASWCDGTDSDGDGVPDCYDTCPGFDDGSDADGDGIPDGCDLCPIDPTC